MKITVNDLDKELKDCLSSEIMSYLFRKYSTLPMEDDKIYEAIDSTELKSKLDRLVASYYLEVAERNVDVDISTDDYKRVYMHLV